MGGGGSSQEAPPSRPNPTWGLPPSGASPSLFGVREEGRRRCPPFLSLMRRERQEGPPLPFPSPRAGQPREGVHQPLCGLVCPPLWPIRPIHLPGVPGTPSGDPISTQCTPKLFRCLNTIILYINFYLSTISRLLIMSVISSGTPNNIRSPTYISHIILYRQRTLSVRTLRVRE